MLMDLVLGSLEGLNHEGTLLFFPWGGGRIKFVAPRSPQEACYGVFYSVAWICVWGLATCRFRQGDAAWFGMMTFDFFFFSFFKILYFIAGYISFWIYWVNLRFYHWCLSFWIFWEILDFIAKCYWFRLGLESCY